MTHDGAEALDLGGLARAGRRRRRIASPGVEHVQQPGGLADALNDDRDVPRSGSESAIVMGIRSPCSWTRRITNWPGLALAGDARAPRSGTA